MASFIVIIYSVYTNGVVHKAFREIINKKCVICKTPLNETKNIVVAVAHKKTLV